MALKRNEYYLTYKPIALEKWDMPVGLEYMAETLVKYGRFRIDANIKSNFVRCEHPEKNINFIFSYRELYDEALVPTTKNTLAAVFAPHYKGQNLARKTQNELTRLRSLMKNKIKPSIDEELKLARIVVQATEPAVMLLIIAERTEVFISYSHMVGDMLDIESWQSVGSSSGLQSTDGRVSSVFISCGGNPLVPEKDIKYFGDGFRAKARAVVIGGQELGHYADIIRDSNGRIVGRHSANIYGNKASEKARKARLSDIETCKHIEAHLRQSGLGAACEFERQIKFYRKQKKTGRMVNFTGLRAKSALKKLFKQLHKHKLDYFSELKKYPYPATELLTALRDMQFNLEPKADAYSRENKTEEEAIACIEALARVPQQVNKWGHQITAAMMPQLYRIYYNEVIPSCIEAYENITGYKYSMNYRKPWIPLKIMVKRLFSLKKPWKMTRPLD